VFPRQQALAPAIPMLDDLAPRELEDGARQASGGDDIPKLCRKLRRGDEDAFTTLHSRWHERLHRYCLVLARGDETATHELVQACYLRVLRHLRPLPDEEALWNWLAKAARHAAADRYRRSSRYRRAIERFTRQFRPPPQETESPLERALEEAVAALTADERELLRERYEARTPLVEIGRRRGISSRAVEGRLARLRERLRRATLDRLDPPHP